MMRSVIILLVVLLLYTTVTEGITTTGESEGPKRRQAIEFIESIIDDGKTEDIEKRLPLDDCFGKSCDLDTTCCDGSACVDLDKYSNSGYCLPKFGRRHGETCKADRDCKPGFICILSVQKNKITRNCQPETRSMRKKQFNDECSRSSECDLDAGLCCLVQRRHRQSPRKVCFYYRTPRECLDYKHGFPFY